jgi:hypothetical protein
MAPGTISGQAETEVSQGIPPCGDEAHDQAPCSRGEHMAAFLKTDQYNQLLASIDHCDGLARQ